MTKVNGAKEILDRYKSQAEFVGVRVQRKFNNFADIRNGKIDNSGFGDDFGVMIEVMNNGYIAYGATNIFSWDSLDHAFETAKKYVELQQKLGIYQFKSSIRGSKKIQFQTSNHSFKSQDIPEVIKYYCQKTEAAKKHQNIQTAKTHFNFYNHNIEYLNNTGAEVIQSLDYFYIKNMLVASKDGESQSRSFEHMSSADKIKLDLTDNFEQLAKEVNELILAPNCPTGELDVILPPDQMYIQIHESIGHPLELDRILGDERNYAGWSFLNIEDFGKLKYGSSLLNITFDPTIKSELASFATDETGVEAKKVYLIKDGILQAGIGGIESQQRSGVQGVTSQRSTSWNRPPIDRMGNINLEVGSSTLKQMISSVENGLIMETNKSWSIDDYRNKFQFGCEYGRVIKNGELKGVVKNPNYRGISVPFWNSLKMVGDQSTYKIFGTAYCGKGEPNQVINVGHATPTCLFEKVQVFGGDS